MDIRQKILALEESHLNSINRLSKDYLDNLLSNDFVEFGASGKVWNKQDVITAVLQEETEIKVERKIKKFQINCLAEDAILSTYQCDVYLSDGSLQRSSLRSSIWKKQKSQWKMIFHQGTLTNNTSDLS